MICFMFPGQPLFHDAALPADDDFAAVAELTRSRTGLGLTSFTWGKMPIRSRWDFRSSAWP